MSAPASATLVQEAARLFEADFNRKPYSSGARDFLVSPVNARERLAAFLKGAKRELLIYGSGLTDNAMIRILENRRDAGVEIRIIGKVEKGHGLSRGSIPGQAPAPARHRARRPRASSSAARACASWSSTRGERSASSSGPPRS